MFQFAKRHTDSSSASPQAVFTEWLFKTECLVCAADMDGFKLLETIGLELDLPVISEPIAHHSEAGVFAASCHGFRVAIAAFLFWTAVSSQLKILAGEIHLPEA